MLFVWYAGDSLWLLHVVGIHSNDFVVYTIFDILY